MREKMTGRRVGTTNSWLFSTLKAVVGVFIITVAGVVTMTFAIVFWAMELWYMSLVCLAVFGGAVFAVAQLNRFARH